MNSKIRIAFFHDRFPMWGAEKITDIISEELTKIGYEVYIFSSKFDFSISPQKLSNSSYITLPNSIGHKGNQQFIIDKINELDINVSIFCVVSLKDVLNIRELTNSKVIFILHNEPFWTLKYKRERGRLKKQQSIGKLLEWYVLQYPKHFMFNSLKYKVASTYRQIYEHVDIFGVLSQGYVDTMESELGVERASSKFRAIYNPAMPLEEPIMTKKKHVIFVGRLTYADKRVDRLLLAWSKIYNNHPDWRLHIVGTGENESYFKELASDLKLDNIKFLGYSKNTIEHYRDASILCMTSATEGMPNVIYEAQMYGVASIAINCCKGIEELLSPSGVNGILVEDENDFAAELSNLMSDESLRSTIQHSAYEHIKQHSLSVVLKNWDDLLKGLLLDKQ